MSRIYAQKKRVLSLALALVMLLSCTDLGLVTRTWAEEGTGSGTSITDAQLVARNYALTDEEKALLESPYIASEKHSYTAPTKDVLELDTAEKTVTAKNYKDAEGNTWTQAKVEIIADGKVAETVTDFEDVTGGKKATYTYDGNAFTVKVYYELYFNVKKNTIQLPLLSIPAELKNGVDNLDSVYAVQGNLSTLENATVKEAMDVLRGEGKFGLMFGDDAKEAANNLYDQYTTDSQKFELTRNMETYATGKVKFLLNEGATFKTTLSNTIGYVTTILADGVWNNSLATSYKNLVYTPLENWLEVANKALNNKDGWDAAGEAGLVENNMQSDDWADLDKKVGEITVLTDVDDLTLEESLLAATETVECSANMYTVTVNATLQKVDADNKLTDKYSSGSTTVTLNKGADKAAVETAIASFKSQMDSEAKTYYGEGNYDVSGYPELGDSFGLSKDETYTVTYSPKQYTVTDWDGNETNYYYGYQLTLPENPTDGMVWEYKIGDVSYAQGEVYTVKGSTTITRTADNASDDASFLEAVIDSNSSVLSDEEKQILGSGALNDTTYTVRYPQKGDKLVSFNKTTGELTADRLNAKCDDLTQTYWTPYYKVDDGTEQAFGEPVGDTYKATVDSNYKKIEVIYRLELGDADDAANLPAELVAEAKQQMTTLGKLYGYREQMKSVAKGEVSSFRMLINGSDINDKQALLDAIDGLLANCFNDTYLKLYDMLASYSNANWDYLAYYYADSGEFKMAAGSGSKSRAAAEPGQLDYLVGYLGTVAEYKDDLETVLAGTKFAAYIGQLTTLKDNIEDVRDNLILPNEAIDTSSAKLTEFVRALKAADGTTFEEHTGSTARLTVNYHTELADNTYTISVTLKNGKNERTVTSAACDEGEKLSSDEVETFKTAVKDAITSVLKNNNSKYYTTNYDETAFSSELDKTLSSDATLAYTWTAIEYTVKIDGETDQTVTIENGKITLPKAEAGYKYTYTIGSNTIVVGDSEDGSYTFGAEHFDDSSLFVSNTCTITRTTTNVSVDKLDKFVQSLNGTNGAITAKLSADRKTLTVTVDSGASGKKADMMSFALALVNNDYGYIGLKDEKDVSKAFINGGEVSVQALLDALTLESTTIANVIGEDGKVTTNNLLLTAPLQLGKDSAGNFEQELTLELRLAAEKQAPDSLIPLRNLSSLATFKLSGGELDITLNLPQEVYEVYLAALLLTGTDLDDINKLDKKVAYKFLWDLTQPAVNGTDAETYKNTITNTLGALGKDEKINAYLETYEGYVNKTLNYLNNALTFDENGYTMSLNASATRLNQLINALLGDSNSSLAQFTSVVKELKEGGSVRVAVKADISNLANRDYQALIFDRGEWNNGVKGKLDMIDLETDLAGRLTEVKSTCGIILLKDIAADLTFTTNTYLDLNGHKITGDVTVAAGAKLTVIDSSLATDSKAGIYGSLTVNGNLAILAGTYKSGESKTDVKEYLKNGYVQNDDGLVSNQYYTVVEDEKGNLTVELNADALNREITNKTFTAQLVKATALDICGDIFLNYYATAMLKVDDETIFDVGEFDLVELWKEPSTKDALITKAADVFDEYGITALTNKIVKELTSFAKVAENIENGEDIISFKLETAPWRVWLKHNTEGNYLDLAIGSNKSDASAASTASESAENTTNGVVSKTMNVAVKIVGNDEAKITKIANQFEKLSVIEVDAGIDYDDSETKTTFDIAYAEKTVKATGSAHADITVNLSEPEYAVVLGVILVSTADKNEIGDIVKADLVSGIQAYYNKEGVTKLKDAFDNVNVNNILKALAQLNYKDEDKTMKSMFTNLGFNDSQATAAATALGDTYYRLLDGFGWAVDIALDALGKSDAGSGYGLAGLAANAEKYGQYVADKQDVTRKATKTIAGYTFYCEMKASSVSITVNLFQSTVSFDAGDGGKGSLDSVLVKTGETYKLPACTFTAPADKEFKCWSVGGVEKAVGDTITVNGPITITAVWQDKSAPTTYTVSGTVKSYDVEQSNVTVTLTDSENTVQTAITDESGKYEFTGIAAGTYTLSVTKSGCAKWTKTVAVTDNNVTENISIYLLGDVNLDGRVTEKDLIVLKRHLANAEKYPLSDEAKNVANINHDDAVSEKDVIVLKRYLANSIKYSLG